MPEFFQAFLKSYQQFALKIFLKSTMFTKVYIVLNLPIIVCICLILKCAIFIWNHCPSNNLYIFYKSRKFEDICQFTFVGVTATSIYLQPIKLHWISSLICNSTTLFHSNFDKHMHVNVKFTTRYEKNTDNTKYPCLKVKILLPLKLVKPLSID